MFAFLDRIFSLFFTRAKPLPPPLPTPTVEEQLTKLDIKWIPITVRPKGLHASYKEETCVLGHFFYLNKSGVAFPEKDGDHFDVVKFSEGGSSYKIILEHLRNQ